MGGRAVDLQSLDALQRVERAIRQGLDVVVIQ